MAPQTQFQSQSNFSPSVLIPESNDWRSELQPDSRQRIVNKILETLKRHLPFSGQEGLIELKNITKDISKDAFHGDKLSASSGKSTPESM
ncbi:hypothetical protein LIER_38686 [Lithospermum erythrorhizon]|uniref:Mediator complex subunit 15 KIX domain-containing protein n=1 Tax=Lithospermum erythrorhizon TaxID=34254 RepID=A0AAV3Q5X1_LITER